MPKVLKLGLKCRFRQHFMKNILQTVESAKFTTIIASRAPKNLEIESKIT